MSIERSHSFGLSAIVFLCDGDGCGAGIDTGFEDWNDAIREFRSSGWVSRRTSGGWEHYCTECKAPGE